MVWITENLYICWPVLVTLLHCHILHCLLKKWHPDELKICHLHACAVELSSLLPLKGSQNLTTLAPRHMQLVPQLQTGCIIFSTDKKKLPPPLPLWRKKGITASPGVLVYQIKKFCQSCCSTSPTYVILTRRALTPSTSTHTDLENGREETSGTRGARMSLVCFRSVNIES